MLTPQEVLDSEAVAVVRSLRGTKQTCLHEYIRVIACYKPESYSGFLWGDLDQDQ